MSFYFGEIILCKTIPKLRIEGSAVRSGDFKFIKNKETDALYNLRDEISEQTNLKISKKQYL